MVLRRFDRDGSSHVTTLKHRQDRMVVINPKSVVGSYAHEGFVQTSSKADSAGIEKWKPRNDNMRDHTAWCAE